MFRYDIKQLCLNKNKLFLWVHGQIFNTLFVNKTLVVGAPPYSGRSTAGGRAQEAIDIAREHGADVRAIAILVDRSNGQWQPDVPLHSLVEMEVETFEPDKLPDDLAGTEAIHPGSK